MDHLKVDTMNAAFMDSPSYKCPPVVQHLFDRHGGLHKLEQGERFTDSMDSLIEYLVRTEGKPGQAESPTYQSCQIAVPLDAKIHGEWYPCLLARVTSASLSSEVVEGRPYYYLLVSKTRFVNKCFWLYAGLQADKVLNVLCHALTGVSTPGLYSRYVYSVVLPSFDEDKKEPLNSNMDILTAAIMPAATSVGQPVEPNQPLETPLAEVVKSTALSILSQVLSNGVTVEWTDQCPETCVYKSWGHQHRFAHGIALVLPDGTRLQVRNPLGAVMVDFRRSALVEQWQSAQLSGFEVTFESEQKQGHKQGHITEIKLSLSFPYGEKKDTIDVCRVANELAACLALCRKPRPGPHWRVPVIDGQQNS